jgi:hypothetical protein
VKKECKEKVRVIDAKPEELAQACMDNPKCRQKFIEGVKEDVEDALQATLVNAIRSANERPPIWWQWLLLFVFGSFAGLGLGIVLAAKTGVVSPSLPPPPG